MIVDYQNTSFEVKKAKPDIAVLPIGATEQCGAHLPVGTSTIILDRLARDVSKGLEKTVYLLPTLPLGTSGLHLGRPGTIALEWSTLMSVLYDLVESLVVQGIHKVVVINGLGGPNLTTVQPRKNYIVKTVVRQLNYDFPELDALWVQPFSVAGRDLEDVLDSGEDDVHAGELATALMLYLAPNTVGEPAADCLPDVGTEYLDFVAFETLCPSGVWGRPGLASGEKGRQAMDVAVRRTIQYIEECFGHLATMKRRIYY